MTLAIAIKIFLTLTTTFILNVFLMTIVTVDEKAKYRATYQSIVTLSFLLHLIALPAAIIGIVWVY